MVTALNKSDRLLPNGAADIDVSAVLARLGEAAALAANPVAISARTESGFSRLLGAVEAALEVDAAFVPVTLAAPFARSDLVDRFHTLGRVEETSFDETGTTLVGLLPERELGRFAPYLSRRPLGSANGRAMQGATTAQTAAGI